MRPVKIMTRLRECQSLLSRKTKKTISIYRLLKSLPGVLCVRIKYSKQFKTDIINLFLKCEVSVFSITTIREALINKNLKGCFLKQTAQKKKERKSETRFY